MKNKIHTFQLDLDWKLINTLSQIDRFDASWISIEKKEGSSLHQLKQIETVRSVGASTRIEGSLMSDDEVRIFLDKKIDISNIEDRDSQEVLGYYETLDIICESFNDIDISESSIKNLHNFLCKYSAIDQWHKGDYKQQNNAVEATFPDGKTKLLFETTEAGIPTQSAMRDLIEWYKQDKETHPLVKCAVFTYDFVSIHPFQDGNGRLSRLLTTLLLLKTGYKWIQYVSFEHEIESRKSEYYRMLRTCQATRPGENISPWIDFFFSTLSNIQDQLMKKLKYGGAETELSIREKSIVGFITNHPGCKSGEIADKLGIPLPSIKRILGDLLKKQMIERHGIGPGTHYTAN
jgi:Fic family protein